MEYLILVIVFLVIISVISKKTFYWGTVVAFLWKHVYREANTFSLYLNDKELDKDESKEEYDEFIKYNREKLSIPGNLINAILDYVNRVRRDYDEDAEEETFGYGYYNFDTIFNTIKRNPGAYKNK